MALTVLALIVMTVGTISSLGSTDAEEELVASARRAEVTTPGQQGAAASSDRLQAVGRGVRDQAQFNAPTPPTGAAASPSAAADAATADGGIHVDVHVDVDVTIDGDGSEATSRQSADSDSGTATASASASASARPSSSEPAPSPTTVPSSSAPAPPTSSEAPDPTSEGSTVTPPAPVAGAALPASGSGLGWRSGVYVPGSSPAAYEAFAAWRGSPLDVVVDWSARSSWNDITNPTWLIDAWKNTSYTKAIGVAMIPESGGASIATCASGAYNDKWVQFGTTMAASGMADSTIIRLGWEFNGDWYVWQAKDPSAWAACWRNIVTAAESKAPGLRWEWNVNRGPGKSVVDARKAYPGDSFVDVVGVDSYDMWPGVTSEAAWQEHYSGAYGLKFWSDFAREHGKPLSVPEWGVYPGTAQAASNGGDNPLYMQKMVEFFRSQGSQLAYEAYFNESASYYAGSIFAPTQNSRAAGAYRAAYSG